MIYICCMNTEKWTSIEDWEMYLSTFHFVFELMMFLIGNMLYVKFTLILGESLGIFRKALLEY